MTDEELLDLFRKTGALLEGHFLLSSGLRSNRYIQCARVLMYPGHAERIADEMALYLPTELKQIDMVISPAMGGLIIGQMVACSLGVPHIFVERQPDRSFALRRFEIKPGTRLLLVEDVVTTGLSSREAILAAERAGGTVVGVTSIIDRSNGQASFDVPFHPLLTLDVETFAENDTPEHLRGAPVVKPGSRPS